MVRANDSITLHELETDQWLDTRDDEEIKERKKEDRMKVNDIEELTEQTELESNSKISN